MAKKTKWYLNNNSQGVYVSCDGHGGGEVWEYDTEAGAKLAAEMLRQGIRPDRKPETWVDLAAKPTIWKCKHCGSERLHEVCLEGVNDNEVLHPRDLGFKLYYCAACKHGFNRLGKEVS